METALARKRTRDVDNNARARKLRAEFGEGDRLRESLGDIPLDRRADVLAALRGYLTGVSAEEAVTAFTVLMVERCESGADTGVHYQGACLAVAREVLGRVERETKEECLKELDRELESRPGALAGILLGLRGETAFLAEGDLLDEAEERWLKDVKESGIPTATPCGEAYDAARLARRIADRKSASGEEAWLPMGQPGLTRRILAGARVAAYDRGGDGGEWRAYTHLDWDGLCRIWGGEEALEKAVHEAKARPGEGEPPEEEREALALAQKHIAGRKQSPVIHKVIVWFDGAIKGRMEDMLGPEMRDEGRVAICEKALQRGHMEPSIWAIGLLEGASLAQGPHNVQATVNDEQKQAVAEIARELHKSEEVVWTQTLAAGLHLLIDEKGADESAGEDEEGKPHT